jgi:hypothetical protein
MEALGATFFVFEGNHIQLRNAILAFEKPENSSKLWNVDNREVLGQFQREIMRLLHNFLASAATLIDHTRTITRELYEEHRFLQEYEREMTGVFSQSSIAGFVRGLRNWMLHKGLVPVVVQLSFAVPNDTSVSSVVLDLGEMTSWDGWDSRAKAFLAEATSDPRLSDVVESYAVLVLRFYRWLEKRMLELHGSAFQELDELQNRLKALNVSNREN